MIAENPSYPYAGQKEEVASLLVQRFALAISLLDDPVELAAGIKDITSESNFDPAIFSVRETSRKIGFCSTVLSYLPLSLKIVERLTKDNSTVNRGPMLTRSISIPLDWLNFGWTLACIKHYE